MQHRSKLFSGRADRLKLQWTISWWQGKQIVHAADCEHETIGVLTMEICVLTSSYSRRVSYSPFDLMCKSTLELHRHPKYCSEWQRLVQTLSALWARRRHQRWMRSSGLKVAILLSRDQAQISHQLLYKKLRLIFQQGQVTLSHKRHLITQRRHRATKMRLRQILHLSMHRDPTMRHRRQAMITCCGKMRRRVGSISEKSE